jgi:hypothetical protein
LKINYWSISSDGHDPYVTVGDDSELTVHISPEECKRLTKSLRRDVRDHRRWNRQQDAEIVGKFLAALPDERIVTLKAPETTLGEVRAFAQ